MINVDRFVVPKAAGVCIKEWRARCAPLSHPSRPKLLPYATNLSVVSFMKNAAIKIGQVNAAVNAEIQNLS